MHVLPGKTRLSDLPLDKSFPNGEVKLIAGKKEVDAYIDLKEEHDGKLQELNPLNGLHGCRV